jgi:two-component system sensor histidine kinase/response regulator
VDAIRQALIQGAPEEAHRRAHNLKGLAANIGADQLAHDALAVEQAIRDGALAGVDALLEHVTDPLLQLCRAITRLLASVASEPAPRAVESVAPQELLAQLEQLAALLAEDDSLAIKRLEPISAALRGHPSGEAFGKVVQTARAYDYPAALAALAPVRQLLQAQTD